VPYPLSTATLIINLLKNNYTKNKIVNGTNVKNNHDYLEFFLDNFFENFRFDQSMDLEVLLEKYII
jgi:hypothetical protein